MRWPVRALVLLVTLVIAATAGEAALRLVDGYRLRSWRLVPVSERVEVPATPLTEWPTTGANEIAAPLVKNIPVPAGVDLAWFVTDPPIAAAKPARPDLDALSGEATGATLAKFARRVWNLNFVTRQARSRESYWEYLKQIQTPLRVFDPADHSEYPRYRMVPNDPHAEAWPTGTFASNNLGYRGADVTLPKPAKTVRIVFVGASTTIDHPSFALSFTDYVAHYLNLWGQSRGLDVRFEAVNTAREGLQSTDLAAVVDQEVLTLAPDIVVYKEGANQFGEAKRLLTVTKSEVTPITPDFLATGLVGGAPANYHSNARRRLDLLLANLRPVGEAPRPPYVVNWPAGLSEESPDLSRADLPLDLPTILRDLRHIKATLAPTGADLAVSSFVWMADEGLRLRTGRANERAIYWYLNGNDVLWPLAYRDIRRFADFQNVTFQRFAKTSGAHFVDLARWFPRDPALFIDGIHISYPGVKLHGWVTFLELLPLVERRLESQAATVVAGGASPVTYSTVTIAEVLQRISAGASALPLPPLDLWTPATAEVKVTPDGSRRLVQGTATRWAYQLVSPRIPVTPDTQYVVNVPTKVTAGVIGIGILDQSGNTWISSPLDSSPFTFSSGKNSSVQIVIADATPTLGTVRPSVFTIGPPQ